MVTFLDSDDGKAAMPVTELMDTPAGRDERGTPDGQIERCSCGVLFRKGSWHKCEHVGERVDWERYKARNGDTMSDEPTYECEQCGATITESEAYTINYPGEDETVTVAFCEGCK